VRPDSGEPCATSLKCLELLYEKFGGPRSASDASRGLRVEESRRWRAGGANTLSKGLESSLVASTTRSDRHPRPHAVDATASFAQVR